VGLDRTHWPELLVGLERVRVLEVARGRDGRLHVAVETTDELVACGRCGVRAQVKERDRVALVDLPAFGTPVWLVWVKRRWRCREPLCPVARGSRWEPRPGTRFLGSAIGHRSRRPGGRVVMGGPGGR
jgi:hypothetical protein